MTEAPAGIDISGRLLNLAQLQAELEAAGIAVPHGLMYIGPGRLKLGQPIDPHLPDGCRLFAHADDGNPIDLPPEAAAIVDAHVPA